MTKKRKSPVRHRVKSHTRQTRPVKSYIRGSDKLTSPKVKRKILKTTINQTKNFGSMNKEEIAFVKRLNTAEKLIKNNKFKRFSTKEEFDELLSTDPVFRKIIKILGNRGPKSSYELGEKYHNKFRDLEIKLLRKTLKTNKLTLYRGGNLHVSDGLVGKTNFEYGRNVIPFSLSENVAKNFVGIGEKITKVKVPITFIDRFYSPSWVEYQVNLRPFPTKHIKNNSDKHDS